MKYALAFVLAFTPLAIFGEEAGDEMNCAGIENARERLACYDRAYSDRPMPPPKIRTEVIAPPATLGQPSTSPTVPQSQGVPSPSSATDRRIDDATAPNARPGSAAPSSRNRDGGMFARAEKVEFSSVIRTIRAEGEQRMVFLLDNEQIWMQSSPRYMPFKEGDKITIKSGLVGGFMMRNENDVSTRVNRIK